jgi:hypothetical protein
MKSVWARQSWTQSSKATSCFASLCTCWPCNIDGCGADPVACHAVIQALLHLGFPSLSHRARLTAGLASKFVYMPDRDEYRCPAGHVVTRRFETIDKGLIINVYATPARRRCLLKPDCTTGRRAAPEAGNMKQSQRQGQAIAPLAVAQQRCGW